MRLTRAQAGRGPSLPLLFEVAGTPPYSDSLGFKRQESSQCVLDFLETGNGRVAKTKLPLRQLNPGGQIPRPSLQAEVS
jgi:hypothetical protein